MTDDGNEKGMESASSGEAGVALTDGHSDPVPDDAAMHEDTTQTVDQGAQKEFGVPPTLKTFAGIVWRLIVIGFAVYIFLNLLGRIAPVAIAVFLGMILTALALPGANLLSRFMPRVLGVIISLLAIVVAGVIILYWVIESIIEQGPALVSAVNDGIQQLDDWLQNGPFSLTADQLNSFNQSAQSWLENVGVDVLQSAASEAGALGTFVTAAAVFFFATFFFMISGGAIWSWVVGWVPQRAREAVNVSGQIAWGSLSGYTRGMVIVAIADAFLVLIGLLILQVPLAPALAAVVFMGAFIPVIGAPIATLLAAVVALAAKGPITALLVIALTVVVGSFDGDVLQPLVMGKAVSMHPLAIVSVIAGGAIAFGIIGALIAVPIVSALYGVAKFLANRDPDHPFPPQPPPEPGKDGPQASSGGPGDTDQEGTPAESTRRRGLAKLFHRGSQTA